MSGLVDESKLKHLLCQTFRFQEFRQGQREIITSVLQKRDALAVMPTGRGKSLCYQLPAVYQKGLVLVISPLIALMRDQVLALQEKGIAAGCLHSDQTIAEKKQVFREIAKHSSYLLYLSPERVQNPGFAPWIKKANVSLIAIDEAHCISQWGPDFRQDYYRLNILRELRPDIPILTLTATATSQVLWDIRTQLKLHEPKRHVYGFYRPNLYYQVEDCRNDTVKMDFLEHALERHKEGRCIIYAGTRKRCEELCGYLSSRFSGLGYYHAGLGSEERTSIQDCYERGEIRILVATIAFGMGVDHPDVRLIVHYQMPANIESYYQEMGRAGRDEKESTCLLLYSKKDKGLHSFFIRQSDASKEVLNRRWRALETMVQYAEGGECRHAGILTYFRDSKRFETCGHCDICVPSSSRKIVRPDSWLIEGRRESAEEFRRELRQRKGKKRKSTSSVTDQVPLSTEEGRRLQTIKNWRRRYAQSKDIPAFIVFSNKTLKDFAKKNPKNLIALEEVYGLGPQKIEAFGKELLSQIDEHS